MPGLCHGDVSLLIEAVSLRGQACRPGEPAAGGDDGEMRHFDLVVIGSGSGDSVVAGRLREWKVALVDDAAVLFGGTCLNVGCIPSKMFVYTADLAEMAGEAKAFGLDVPTPAVRWQDIRRRVFDRVDRHSAEGLHHRRAGGRDLVLFEGEARFTGPKTLRVVGGETISADRFVIAAGSRPIVPDVPGLADAGFLTNETVMRLDKLPERMVILGAGAIAAEFAHVFSALGVHITVIARSGGMLIREDGDVSRLFSDLACRKWDLRERGKPPGSSATARPCGFTCAVPVVPRSSTATNSSSPSDGDPTPIG